MSPVTPRAPPRPAARGRRSRPAPLSTRPRGGRRSPPRSLARSQAPAPRRARLRPCRGGTRRRSARGRRPAMPGPWSTTRTVTSGGIAETCTCTGSDSGEYLSAFSRRFTSTRSICWASARTSGVRPETRPGLAGPPRPSRRAPGGRGRRSARVPARAVPRRPAGGRGRAGSPRGGRAARPRPGSWPRASLRSSPSELEILPRQCARRCQDGHQGGAEVVADRSEDGRLHGVAPAQGLRLERFARETLAVDREAEERGERRKQPPAGRLAPLARALEVDRPDRAALDDQREALLAPARRPRTAVELDPRPLHLEGLRGLRLDPLELADHLAALEQRGGDLGEERRLPGLAARACCQLAHDDRRDQEDREREPVARVRERERVHRRQEEPVESEHARDRDRNRIREAPDDRHGKHGEDVQSAEAENRHLGLQQLDRAGDRGDQKEADEGAAEPPVPLRRFPPAREAVAGGRPGANPQARAGLLGGHGHMIARRTRAPRSRGMLQA